MRVSGHRVGAILTDMSEIKPFIGVIAMLIVIAVVSFLMSGAQYPQATGIFPQVVSCVRENPNPPTSDRRWQPTLIVEVEPGRDPGRIREYRVLGCTLYYYHAHFK